MQAPSRPQAQPTARDDDHTRFKVLDYGAYATESQLAEVMQVLGRPPGGGFSPLQEARLRRGRELLMYGGAAQGELFELISGQRDHELEVDKTATSGRPQVNRAVCKDCGADLTVQDGRAKSDRARCPACYSAKRKQYNASYRGQASAPASPASPASSAKDAWLP